jgi:hypothetical protein
MQSALTRDTPEGDQLKSNKLRPFDLRLEDEPWIEQNRAAGSVLWQLIVQHNV